jgi:hypothetical protein
VNKSPEFPSIRGWCRRISAPFTLAHRPLAFAGVHRQIARYEDRRPDRHYLPDYLLLTPVGGAVFFIP